MQSGKFTVREFTPIEELKFELSKNQLSKLNAWLVDVEHRAASLQAVDARHKSESARVDYSMVPLPYYGAIGGGLKFTLTPNGVGVSCVATESITGDSIDLTEYEEW